MSSDSKSQISRELWGSVDGKNVYKFTLKNNRAQEVDVISYGATIVAVRTPDKNGQIADVVLGFDNLEGYRSAKNPYFGATIGRVANRIGQGRFTLDGVEYQVSRNKGENSLHGGEKGWNSKIWNYRIEENRVVMTLLSENGDEGYPGAVIASVEFELTEDGELCIRMKAFADVSTPLNLTNHSYFNLAGNENANAKELYAHRVSLNADRWTVTDSQSIPTGEIRSVEGTAMDLRNAKILGDVINRVPGGGFDYNFCLSTPEIEGDMGMKLVAEASHPGTGRNMKTYSNQPGVQFYTSNFLPEEKSNEPLVGKNGHSYSKHAAFCLETQNYPDAVNHENFPDSILRPGHVYDHVVVYKFGVET